MAETLLQIYSDVARPLGLDPTISSFSENDGSATLVQYIYEAYRYLRRGLNHETNYFRGAGSIGLVDGTRLYDLASDAEGYGLYDWTFVNTTENNAPIQAATRAYVQKTYPGYLTDEGNPAYFYLEGADQVGFYPVPDASYTVTYEYQKEITENTGTSTVFLVPDDWLDFIKKYTKGLWEDSKGFGNAGASFALANELLYQIRVADSRANPTYIW